MSQRVKMKLNICYCLLLFYRPCDTTADLPHTVLEEKQMAVLSCPHSVDGDVVWSKRTEGQDYKILTIRGDTEIKDIEDREKRFSSQADKSLVISKVAASDSGRYLCDRQPAVDLTVIPAGTEIERVAEKSSVTLKCRPTVGGSDVPTWRKDAGQTPAGIRIQVSPDTQTMTITDIRHEDSGLYHCGGKPAAYLLVSTAKTSLPLWLPAAGGAVLLVALTLTIGFVWRRLKRREAESTQNDPTYTEIWEPPKTSNETESPYSLLGHSQESRHSLVGTSGNYEDQWNHQGSRNDEYILLQRTNQTISSV